MMNERIQELQAEQSYDVAHGISSYHLQEEEQEPVCKRCNGTKIVPDGKMYSVDGFQLEVPIECVKDCPDCTAPVRTKDLTAQEKANIIYAADHRNPMAMIDAAIALYREKNK